MAERISLEEFVGNTGTIFYRGKYGFCTGKGPLEQLYIKEAKRDGTHVWGKLDVSEGLWKPYGFLHQIAVSGETGEEGYLLSGTVQVPASFLWLPGEWGEWRFCLKAERKQRLSVHQGEQEWHASAFLETELMLPWLGGGKGIVSWQLFSEDAWIPLQIKLINEKGEAGIKADQCLSAFESLFGVSVDISGFLPEIIPFQSAVKLYGVSYGYSADGTYRMKSAAVDFGFEQAKANLQLQTGICALQSVRFLMGLSMEKGNKLFGSICLNLTIFGHPLSVLAEYPGFRIRIDLPFHLALEEAANALQLSLPKEFRDMKLEYLSLEAALNFSDFSMQLRFMDMVRLPLLSNGAFCLEQTDFMVEKGEAGLTARLGGLLSLYENTERMTGFYVGASFGQQGMELEARLIEPADFFRILKALTGSCPVTGFTIALTGMELYGC